MHTIWMSHLISTDTRVRMRLDVVGYLLAPTFLQYFGFLDFFSQFIVCVYGSIMKWVCSVQRDF